MDTVEELDVTVFKASRNKAAGVDDVPTKAWQWLTADNKEVGHPQPGAHSWAHPAGMAKSIGG